MDLNVRYVESQDSRTGNQPAQREQAGTIYNRQFQGDEENADHRGMGRSNEGQLYNDRFDVSSDARNNGRPSSQSSGARSSEDTVSIAISVEQYQPVAPRPPEIRILRDGRFQVISHLSGFPTVESTYFNYEDAVAGLSRLQGNY